MVEEGFSNKSFYGNKYDTPQDIDRKAKLLRRERELKKNILLPQYQPRLKSLSLVVIIAELCCIQ